MATVELKNVYKIYEGSDKPAVCNANIKVEDKEFVVLVGPSGCGKSTILRMIAGLESITKGELYIDNIFVNNLPPKDRDIAMVFQNYALYPHMSVYDNMAFGLKIRKIPNDEIDKRVREAAKILHLENYLNRKPKALSGGQRQRVAVGRAIVRNPKVFLFDEPLSNLDAKLRVQMRAEIISLHQKLESTMIYVTHDQIEAMTMGDKIVVINDGIIQQIGSPLELYNNPINKFVAGFIGSPPMNFIEVNINYRDNLIELINGDFKIEINDTEKVNLLKAYNNKVLIMGIRPEDIHDDKKSNFYSLKANVEIIEPLGADTYVHFNLGNVSFLATFRASTTAHHNEKNRKVYFDMSKIYFFDPENDFKNILKK